MQGVQPRAEFHQNKLGKVKLRTHGKRVGETICVLMPGCHHTVKIIVSCSGACTRGGACRCLQKVMTFDTARKCSHCGCDAGSTARIGAAATGSTTPTATGSAASAAAAAAAASASASDAAAASSADLAQEELPSWWGAESDARFAECLYVAQMDGGYIQDRFYKQDTHLSQLFPTVGLEQWLDAKEWVQRSAKGGGIAARRRALGKSRRLRFVNLSATRPSRRRTPQGAPDSSGAAWQTDDGARLYHDEDGRVYKVRPGQRAASSSVLALL